jgi:hypothetical protein
VSPVRYELGFYIPKDGILHSRRRENLRFYNTDNKSRLLLPEAQFFIVHPKALRNCIPEVYQ